MEIKEAYKIPLEHLSEFLEVSKIALKYNKDSFTWEIYKIPRLNEAYLIPQYSIATLLPDIHYLEDFSYSDDINLPEGISENEWLTREEVWGYILDNVTSVSFEIVN